jgi:hypothetical protein
VITLAPGTYFDGMTTVRAGAFFAPITVRAAKPRTAIVTRVGRVLTVNHPSFVVEGLVLDGQYGPDDTVRVASGGSDFVLRDTEVRRSSRDLIDLGNVQRVLIEGCLLHHALNPTDGRSDAHGIVGGAVINLTVRNTEIHTFSGDGIQVDSGRAAPGWDNVIIEGANIWLAPLPVAENGFPAGAAPGENAVDTKAAATNIRSHITIRNTIARGFRNGLIGNMAAFNLKEHVDVTLDGITVSESEIAFRLRGAAGGNGAVVAIRNAVVYDVATAFRYEDNIQNLRIWNSTIGRDVATTFQNVAAPQSAPDVRNLLSINPLQAEARQRSNLQVGVDAFVDASMHDYHLASGAPAVDAGEPVAQVTIDRDGVERPQGRAPDVGAYEQAAPAPAGILRP